MMRTMVSFYDSDSFRDFIEEKRVLVNPSIAMNLGSKSRLDFDVEYYFTENVLDGGLIAVGDGVADIPFSTNLGNESEHGDFQNFSANLGIETEITPELVLKNSAHYNINNWDVFNVLPLFLDEDNRTLNRSVNRLDYRSHIFYTQHELYYTKTIAGADNQFMAGVDYTYEDVDNLSEANLTVPIDVFDPIRLPLIEGPGGELSHSERNVNNHGLGLYVQDFINIEDYLYILAGLRFDYTDYKLHKTEFEVLSNMEKSSETYYSPRFGVMVKPLPNLGLYANYSKSFNQIIGYAISVDGSLFDAEKTEQS